MNRPRTLFPSSLQHRIVTLVTLVTLMLATAGCVASVLLTQSVLHASIDEQLRTTLAHRHTSVADLAEEMPAGSVVIRHRAEGDEVRVVGDDRMLAAADQKPLDRLVVSAPGLYTVSLPERDDMRVIVKDMGDHRTLVAMSLEGTERDVARLAALEFLCWLLGGATAVVIAIALTRRLTRPLEEISATARTIASAPTETVTDAVSRRVPVAVSSTAEVGAVAASLNAMLEQVEAALQRRDASQEALRTFLADVSHELRTPIAVIRSHAELGTNILNQHVDALVHLWPGNLAPGERMTPEQIDELVDGIARLRPAGDQLLPSLDRIDAESRRMGRLVDDLLVLARLDGPTQPEPDQVDVTYIALEVLSDAKLLAPQHRWAFEADDVPVEVMANEDAVRRVVLNLVTNARRHTPAGTRVGVSVKADDAGAVLAVSDDGPGLPARVAEAPGRRFVGRDHADEQSTGLGLAITVSLVESLGGTITFDSNEHGTRVTVRLPERPVTR